MSIKQLENENFYVQFTSILALLILVNFLPSEDDHVVIETRIKLQIKSVWCLEEKVDTFHVSSTVLPQMLSIVCFSNFDVLL